jgi:uncharacterized protein (UPF0332 family)
MDVKECFDKRLLRKIQVDKLKVESSLRIAENKILRAKELAEEEFFNEALVSAYTSMFHAARALLYRDGIQEKSHFAVYIYLNEKYSGKIPSYLIEAFKVYQQERHQALYGFDYNAGKDDAESALVDSEEFLTKIKNILENGKL